jgi:hypothetical protein
MQDISGISKQEEDKNYPIGPGSLHQRISEKKQDSGIYKPISTNMIFKKMSRW